VNDAVMVPKYRRAAERLQAEILDFPELDAAVSALESLCQRSAA
jgi:SpoU rRNA methylase family enzyme